MPERQHRSPSSWLGAMARALLPGACCLCGGQAEAPVCEFCRTRYAAERRPRCPRCANPVEPAEPIDTLCGTCLAHEPAFDATLVAVDYAAPLDQLVLQLKFGAQLALAPWCAQMLRDVVLEQEQFGLPNVLCPVPLGVRRLSERGFNQALEIARPLSAMLGVPCAPRLMLRTLETQAQSSLAPGQRAANIRRAFVPSPEALTLLRGQHVGVVDDVMSSGQTLNEMAATLKRFGAARVSNLVFARTPPR
jgi:ComF family protein